MNTAPLSAATALAAAPPSNGDDALRKACVQLEAVFLQELMKALRDTVPASGLADGGAGEEIFSSLLDTQLTESMAQRLERGLAAALYRQLRGPGAEPGAPADAAGAPHAVSPDPAQPARTRSA